MYQSVTIKNNTATLSYNPANRLAGSSCFVSDGKIIKMKEKQAHNIAQPTTQKHPPLFASSQGGGAFEYAAAPLRYELHKGIVKMSDIEKYNEKLKENRELKNAKIDSFFRKLFRKKEEHKLNKSKIKSKIYAFAKSIQQKIKFFTITFPQHTPDDLCFKFFNEWLTYLRKNNHIDNYLWVAERQKNTTIHYHLITNCFMPINLINKYMKIILINYQKKHGYNFNTNLINYNGVDVDKISRHKKVSWRSLSIYLTKYITKNNLQIKNHYIWFSSRSLSAIFTSQAFPFTEEFLDLLDKNLKYTSIIVDNEALKIVSFKENKLIDSLTSNLISINCIILDSFCHAKNQ